MLRSVKIAMFRPRRSGKSFLWSIQASVDECEPGAENRKIDCRQETQASANIGMHLSKNAATTEDMYGLFTSMYT